MKKTRRTVLFLESLENRVVPSHLHALVAVDHGAAEAPTAVETETPQRETIAPHANGSEVTGFSKAANAATIWEMSASDKSSPSPAETNEHTDSDQSARSDQNEHSDSDQGQPDSAEKEHNNSDHGAREDKSRENVHDSSSEDATRSLGDTSESMEKVTADLGKEDSGATSDKKAADDSENSQAKNSENEHSDSNPTDSLGNSLVHSDSASASNTHSDDSSAGDKGDSTSSSSVSDSRTGSGLTGVGSKVETGDLTDSGASNSTAKDKDNSNSTASSSASRTDSGLTDRGSAKDTGDVSGSGSAISKNVDSTGTSPVSDKNDHAKSSSNHKDLLATGNSTNVSSPADSTQTIAASDVLAGQSRLPDSRLAPGGAESNLLASESVSASPIGYALDNEGFAFSSVAAIVTAKEVALNLPGMAQRAIPLAVPAVESFATQLGLGSLDDGSTVRAIEDLAPLAGELIVGFLPVDQVAVVSALGQVLNQIDQLGEQLIGSSAARWLYPFIFTALAATTVYQLASRRRRQFREQSVWSREGVSWSSTWFPLLGSSMQERV